MNEKELHSIEGLSFQLGRNLSEKKDSRYPNIGHKRASLAGMTAALFVGCIFEIASCF